MRPTSHLRLQRRTLIGGLLAASSLAYLRLAAAASPERDLRIVVPFPAGGAVDLFVRTLAEQLRPMLARTLLVDNRPGAAGLMGAKAVAQAAPDGATLLYLHSGLVTVQALNPRLDLLKEFRLIARLNYSPFALVARADSPYKTAAELIAAVRQTPGQLSYGSGGIGSPSHLAVEHMADQLGGFKALHIPFKGAVETVNAMLGGQVDFSISVLGTVLPMVQAGRLRLLALTCRHRIASLPQVPTLGELAVPGFAFEAWGGLAAPAGTPDAVIERITQVLAAAMASAPVKDAAQKTGSELEWVDAGPFAAQLAKDIVAERAVVQRLHLSESR